MRSWNRQYLFLTLMLAFTTSVAFAQCPTTGDAATYRTPPLNYPMTSDRYAVQYQLGSGIWVTARVYISYYGGTSASPYTKPSRYPADESISFVSVPAAANTAVAIRVAKIWGANFPSISQMSVRPKAKGISVTSVDATTVQLATTTGANFAGDQFVLWWNGTASENSDIQGLAIFLDPPYIAPTGSNVMVVRGALGPSDLIGNLAIDTLDFEGVVGIGTTASPSTLGSLTLNVPPNINNIFFGPGSWVQGKLRFTQTGTGKTRKIYGPGVLDVSRFNYANRLCDSSSTHADDGYGAISWTALTSPNAVPDVFAMDGLIISDLNHYADDLQQNGTVNAVKVLSWNGENAALRLGFGTSASNVFIHVGDDSLMVWGSYISVTNATVWQGWNGGVVSIGWDDDRHGDDCLIDGLYVIATDWSMPNTPSWTSTTLNDDNNAIIASMNTPTVSFGPYMPSVYRNIYVEDPPRELLSLKVNPFQCQPSCATGPSVLNLNIENVFTPPSTLQNPIGFQDVNGVPLTGSMNIALTNVMLIQPNGSMTPLTSSNALFPGQGNIVTNGSNINIIYPPSPTVMQFSASPNPASAGQTVTLTATMSPSAATGTVSFFDGATNIPTALGTAALSGGVATTTVKLKTERHLLAASYSGDANYSPNVSTAVNLVVSPLLSTTTLSVVPASPAPGQAVTLTVLVTPSAATGTVTFQDGGVAIGSATLHIGSASVSISTLAVGNHTLTASYSGDANDTPSGSLPVMLTVAVPANLSIAKSHTGNFTQGQQGAMYSIIVSNAAGAGPTSGVVMVTDTVPSAETLVSLAGSGWTCPSGGNTCTRSDVLAASARYPAIIVTVNVAANALSPQINSAMVSGGGSPSASINDSTLITNGGPSSGLALYTVTPCRVVDTRGATGTFGGPAMGAASIRTFPIPQSACNIPANAQAYSLNATVVPMATLSYLSIWPAGQSQPAVSTLNSTDGRIVANAAIVPAGMNGAISLFVSDATNVILDINGYFAPALTQSGQSFYSVTPCRIADTRNPPGSFGGSFMSGGSTRSFAIPMSPCNVPNTAQAYSLNMTAVPRARQLGYLTTWPTGQTQPLVSTLNSTDGGVVANAAIVPAGTGGAISVFVTDDTDVIIDINGYFGPAGSPAAQSLYPVTPCRVVDTRGGGVFTGAFGTPMLAANAQRSFQIPGGPCSDIPATSRTYSLNVTVVPTGMLGYLSAWPTGQTQPVVSTLNSLLGKIVANAAIVPAGQNGATSVFVTDPTQLILDINAYFAP